MGDVSAEPSMEDILSSIKRIIAEEGDGGTPRARRPSVRPVPSNDAAESPSSSREEILELRDPMPPIESAPNAPPVAAAEPPMPIVSDVTAQATRGALASLSRLLVKPEPESDGTLEGLVREMLRPMLREWVDANLPDMVETMVSREIAKIMHAER